MALVVRSPRHVHPLTCENSKRDGEGGQEAVCTRLLVEFSNGFFRYLIMNRHRPDSLMLHGRRKSIRQVTAVSNTKRCRNRTRTFNIGYNKARYLIPSWVGSIILPSLQPVLLTFVLVLSSHIFLFHTYIIHTHTYKPLNTQKHHKYLKA
jgi:hypothetical protein